jgi:hypothetical protein
MIMGIYQAGIVGAEPADHPPGKAWFHAKVAATMSSAISKKDLPTVPDTVIPDSRERLLNVLSDKAGLELLMPFIMGLLPQKKKAAPRLKRRP